MIGYIKGAVEGISADYILLECHDIGYQIYTSGMALASITMHQDMKIYTYLHVREDGVTLFGFPTMEELNTFKQLIGVSGIGPKVALAVLSALTVQELALAVMAGDTKTITKANGIGAKGAARLIMELKDKMQVEDAFATTEIPDTTDVAASQDSVQDTVMALVSLGYSDTEALKAIKQVPGADTMDSEQLLKAALKKIF